MKTIEAEKADYCKRLTKFTKEVIESWEKNEYSGNMIINWSAGLVTGFKPSLVYGVSNPPEMMQVFVDER